MCLVKGVAVPTVVFIDVQQWGGLMCLLYAVSYNDFFIITVILLMVDVMSTLKVIAAMKNFKVLQILM